MPENRSQPEQRQSPKPQQQGGEEKASWPPRKAYTVTIDLKVDATDAVDALDRITDGLRGLNIQEINLNAEPAK